MLALEAGMKMTRTRLLGRRVGGSTGGFSIVELLVAVGLLMTVVFGVLQLVIAARRLVGVAQGLTFGTALADEKLEQLRGLVFAHDSAGAPVTDEQADVTFVPERPTGGAGLRPSPSDALDRNVAGYCDFLGPGGGWLGAGAAPPAGAAFVRRWSIRPLDAAPAQAVVIQVRVLDAAAAARGGTGPADVTATTVRARWAP